MFFKLYLHIISKSLWVRSESEIRGLGVIAIFFRLEAQQKNFKM